MNGIAASGAEPPGEAAEVTGADRFPLQLWLRGPGGLTEVIRVALPLMISTGCLSAVLFADRTLLLWYDGASMSAAMAAGNLFWTLICLPLGIASMTGAFVAQYVGSSRPQRVGPLLWQAVYMALGTIPLWALAAYYARELFIWTGQGAELLDLETAYMRVLMIGALGGVLESALSGFFSGTHRTMTVMWINVAAAVLNLILDLPLIFGWGPVPALGIMGAGIASVISFWFKAIAYAGLMAAPRLAAIYALRSGWRFDRPLMRRFLFFGLPAGLQYVAEAGAFTVIVLQIGQLGSMPLQATTMAINFNMIAFVPLIGVSIAASVLVGQYLTQLGPRYATRAALTALAIGLIYSLGWASLYIGAPRWLMSLYRLGAPLGEPDGVAVDPASADELSQAIDTAVILLRFVAAYLIFDSTQLVLAGVLRGAGDTWFVLLATTSASAVSLGVALTLESLGGGAGGLMFWWYVITGWVWLLAVVMTGRFLQGRWKDKRLVESHI